MKKNKRNAKREKKNEEPRKVTIFLAEEEYALVEEFTEFNQLSSVSEGASGLFSVALRVIDDCAKKREAALGSRYPTLS
jgi:hypothetical protein